MKKKIICMIVFFLLVFSVVACAQVTISSNDSDDIIINVGKTDSNEDINANVNEEPLEELQLNDVPVTIHFFDVGQADCALIECDGEYALMDCGNIADGKLILDYLNSNNISKLKYLYLSHPHEDHMGGAPIIVNNIQIEKTLMPNKVVTTSIFEKLVDALLDKNVETVSPKPNDVFELGKGKFTCLACDNENDELNSTSIVFLFTYNDIDVLFTGDATTEIEKQILSWYQFEDVEVLKLAHHGSKTSSSASYLDAVNPDYIVISVGRGNSYGLPKQEIINRINKLDAKVFRTDLQNTIIMTTDGSDIKFETSSLILDGDGDGSNIITDSQLFSCDSSEANFIASETGSKFHKLDCSYAKKISEEKAMFFKEKDDAVNAGYEPCKSCNP